MKFIMIVAPRAMWTTIYQRIEPMLSKLECTTIQSRERVPREHNGPHLLFAGATPEAEAILLDAVNGIEPIVEINPPDPTDTKRWS